MNEGPQKPPSLYKVVWKYNFADIQRNTKAVVLGGRREGGGEAWGVGGLEALYWSMYSMF